MKPITSISVGAWVFSSLSEDLGDRVTKIYSIFTPQATLPYITYRRTNFVGVASKGGMADTVMVEVTCYAGTYAKSLELAESVRASLDRTRGETEEGLQIRGCLLVDADEYRDGDAWAQVLKFEIKC